MARGLTQQEQKFSKHYALTSNARQSAILAGYSQSNASQAGSRLLKRPRVLSEIKRLECTLLNESKGVTRDMLQGFYVGIMTDRTASIDQRLKASDLLNKLRGFYRRDLDILLQMDSTELEEAITRVRGNVIETQHELLSNGQD